MGRLKSNSCHFDDYFLNFEIEILDLCEEVFWGPADKQLIKIKDVYLKSISLLELKEDILEIGRIRNTRCFNNIQKQKYILNSMFEEIDYLYPSRRLEKFRIWYQESFIKSFRACTNCNFKVA